MTPSGWGRSTTPSASPSGVIQHEMQYLYDPSFVSPDIRLASLRPCTRREAYHADITYGTNNEFGFDYLRDNMRFSLDEMVQRQHHYAIVDEVDSILIDEARTPLIISGRDPSAESRAPMYEKVNRIIPKLTRAATIVDGKLSEIEEQSQGDFIVDEKAKTVSLTEQGTTHSERLLGIENLSDHGDLVHYVYQALKAHHIFAADVDYVVKDRRRSTTPGASRSGRRSSSSTSSPGGSCRGGAGRTACTRRSRPRKASRSRRRTRRSPPSRCRTTSGCTTSWRA